LKATLCVHFGFMMEIELLPTTSSGFKNWADGQNPEE
jgi:hypothetical protein